jgi:hypothetical protein
MQQVADWLEKLGLGQHAQRFADIPRFRLAPRAMSRKFWTFGSGLVALRRQSCSLFSNFRFGIPETAIDHCFRSQPRSRSRLRSERSLMQAQIGSMTIIMMVWRAAAGASAFATRRRALQLGEGVEL